MRMLIVVLAVLITGCATTPNELAPISTTLCSVAAAPSKYNGKQVNFIAYVQSDGMHGTWLSDPACPNLAIDPDSSNSEQSWSEIHKLIWKTGPPGTIDKTIRANFSGIYRKKKFSGILEMNSITNLKFEMKIR
jgi:hypothetical protein